jgi:TolA-binding protein
MGTGKARLLILAAGLLSTSCVYFNTYYNAQKYFRQAEKSRSVDEQKMLDRGEDPRRTPRKPVHKTDNLYESAARRASKVLDEHKESDLVDDAMFLMGRAFYWRRDYITAVRSFADLEENFPNSEFFHEARYWRAMSYEAQRQNSDAQLLFRELFSDGRGGVGPRAGYRLGEMAFEAEDFVAAAQEHRATIEAFPKAKILPDLWLRYGESIMALEDSSRYVEALDAFEQVAEGRPPKQIEYDGRLNKGKALDAMGDGEAGLQEYELLLKDGSFRVFEGQTRLQIGQYYRDRNELDRALDEFEQVRDDFPKSASSAMALYHTSLLYLQDHGDVERAREYLREVGAEKRDSEAALQAQRTLQDLTELDRLTRRIVIADSLGGVQRDSLVTARTAKEPPDTATDSTGVIGSVDSTASDSTTASSAGVKESEGEPSGAAVDEGALAAWFFEEPSIERRDRTIEVFKDLVSLAELYRDQLAQADSALFYYGEVRSRFPDSAQLPLVLYNMGWIHLELKNAPDGAKKFFQILVDEYASSEHANAAREFLGLERRRTADEVAAVEFRRIEEIISQDGTKAEVFVPLLDSLVARFGDTPTAARAAFIAARAIEDVVGDSLDAVRRYGQLEERFPESQFAAIVRDREESAQAGLAAKLERSLKSLGGQLGPGEEMETIAVEPDSVDSVAFARKYFGFALRAHRRGELEDAREYYERSLEERAKNPEALYQLGNIQWEQDYYQDAQDYYRKALRQNQGLLKAHYRMLFAFIAEGREDSSNFYLQKVIKGDRGNEQVRFLIEQYPDLAVPNPEELDLGTLGELELEAPLEELIMPPGELRLREYPLVRKTSLPTYPPQANGDSVEVLLDILVGRDGKPEEVELYDGPEPHASVAVNSAWDYVFYPAEGVDKQPDRDGFEVRAWVELTMPVYPPVGFAATATAAPASEDTGDSAADAEAAVEDSISIGLGNESDVGDRETTE